MDDKDIFNQALIDNLAGQRNDALNLLTHSRAEIAVLKAKIEELTKKNADAAPAKPPEDPKLQ